MGGRVAEQGFETLDCYRLALDVFREAYAVASKLPAIERYNLADQMRRAATSATLNIAEGYGRYHYLDKIRFYYIARGSLTETQAAFISCQAAGYTVEDVLDRQRDLCQRALQALNGLIRYTYRQRQGQKEYGDHALHELETGYATFPDLLGPGSPNPESPDPKSPDPESPDPGFPNDGG
jgi:four helix bundle protein